MSSTKTMIEEITAATDVDASKIRDFLKIREIGIPQTVEDIRLTLNSRYPTAEEKIAAHKIWAALSEEKINTASKFEILLNIMRGSLDESNVEVMLLAVQKAISLRKNRREIAELAYQIKDLRANVKSKVDDIVFPDYLGFVTDLTIALAIRDDFIGTKYTENLLTLTRGFIQGMPLDVTAKKAMYSLYINMDKTHPCAFEMYEKLMLYPHTSEELKTLHARVSADLEQLQKHSPSYSTTDEARKSERTAHLIRVAKNLKVQIDMTFKKELAGIHQYEALIDAFEKTMKLQLEKSQKLIIQRLGKYWAEKLSNASISFNDALAIFKLATRAQQVIGKSKGYLRKAWLRAKNSAHSFEQAGALIDVAAETVHFGSTVEHWLTFNPTLDNLLKLYKEMYRAKKVAAFRDAILKSTVTFDDSLKLLDISYWSECKLMMPALKKAASFISKLSEGLTALGQIAHRENRHIILEATLGYVTDLHELKLVTHAIKGVGYVKEIEESLLIARGLKILSPKPETEEDDEDE